jgi:toxin ParE1/3/4
VAHSIRFAAAALADLQSIFPYVAEAAGNEVAEAYQQRLRTACLALADYPDRGSPRADLVAGLRTVSFERRAVIAYRVEADSVRILRVLHRGRDMGGAFSD